MTCTVLLLTVASSLRVLTYYVAVPTSVIDQLDLRNELAYLVHQPREDVRVYPAEPGIYFSDNHCRDSRQTLYTTLTGRAQ